MDPAALRLLRAQHGVAAVRQLGECGEITPGQVHGWVRRGHLERVDRGVVRAAGAPASPMSQAMAAVLRSGEGARLIGPRALWLLGIRGFGPQDAFGVLVPSHRDAPTNVDFPTYRDPHPGDGAMVADAIPVPPPARLLIEMARWVRGVELRSAVDAARWARRPTAAQLLAALAPLPSRYRPAARIRDLVRAGHLGQESEPERVIVRLLGDRFGPVETQVWVSSRRRVDVLLRRHGIVLEYQGADHRTAAGRRADRARDDELAALGLIVVHVYAEDLRHPTQLRARIQRVINR